jgi:catecholate siderophore receptor
LAGVAGLAVTLQREARGAGQKAQNKRKRIKSESPRQLLAKERGDPVIDNPQAGDLGHSRFASRGFQVEKESMAGSQRIARFIVFIYILGLLEAVHLQAQIDQDLNSFWDKKVVANTGAALPDVPLSSLEGRVLDPMGAAIEGARISAIPEGDSSLDFPTILSSRDGSFVLALSPGRYTIKIHAAGFADSSHTIDVQLRESEMREFMLPIDGPQNTITVTDSPGYLTTIASGTKSATLLRDLPQSVTVVSHELISDQLMMSIGDVVRYIPGINSHQGEGNRDQLVIRGNTSTADFYVDGARDDVQYYRDLYNLDRVEALKGPNALLFGRGGAGGVINRVTKEAGYTPLRAVTLQWGGNNHKRFTADFNQPLNTMAAFRLNGVYEKSDSFRDQVSLERMGIAPALALAFTSKTKLTINYEHFRDNRVADRGIPSHAGKPADVDVATYFGNPDDSPVHARVNLGAVTLQHFIGSLDIRNRTFIGDYDKSYQNYVPGAVSGNGERVSLSAYNNATRRRNIFNQTDLTLSLHSGPIGHELMAGMEVGRQLTDNFRNTGYFNNSATTVSVPLDSPTIGTAATFRQSASDADNHVQANPAALYVQDQIQLSRFVQVTAGIRFDYFDLKYHNNRSGGDLRRIDRLVSPRAGIVYKPVVPLSLYASYSVSYLPSSGDQFASLTLVTEQLKPEKFNNYELGAKWDLDRSLSVSAAVYRLDRINSRSTDPNDPTRIVQTGSQRTLGFEFGINGRITSAWGIAGGYAYQDAFISSANTAAPAGATVAQVPHHTFSLWNNYQFLKRLGGGLGIIHRSDMYAAIDNTVILPGYTRADAALYYSISERMRLQVNVENIAGTRYYANANSNSNISPGSPRVFRVCLSTGF